jgi:hypothetical protein
MVSLRIEADAGTAVTLSRLFEHFGCRVLERAADHLQVGFPDASSEREALTEARLYLSMRPALRGAFRLTTGS